MSPALSKRCPFKIRHSISESRSNIIKNSEQARTRNKGRLIHTLASFEEACSFIWLHLWVFVSDTEDAYTGFTWQGNGAPGGRRTRQGTCVRTRAEAPWTRAPRPTDGWTAKKACFGKRRFSRIKETAWPWILFLSQVKLSTTFKLEKTVLNRQKNLEKTAILKAMFQV